MTTNYIDMSPDSTLHINVSLNIYAIVSNPGLILGLYPADGRQRYVFHWLGANLESVLQPELTSAVQTCL